MGSGKKSGMSNTPAINLSTLPADQRAAVEALIQEVSALKEITKRQEHLIAELNHALHGKRSEKLTEDERQLAFEDLTIAVEEVEAEKETRAASKGESIGRKPAPRRNIGNLPAFLPRIETVIEPDSLLCPCGCGVAIVARSCPSWRHRFKPDGRRRENGDCTRSVKIAQSGWTSFLRVLPFKPSPRRFDPFGTGHHRVIVTVRPK